MLKQPEIFEWYDSIKDDGKWTWTSELNLEEFTEQVKHRTVGWVIDENETVVLVTGSIQEFIHKDGDQSVLNPIAIPKCSIRKRYAIVDKGKL